MKIFKKFSGEAAKIVSGGGIGVIPTDTIYGIVCLALSKKSVERVYKLRKRNPKKPVIVLISSISDLKKFGTTLGPIGYKLLAKLWPGPVSVILPCESRKFSYLHRGTKTIAFRLPVDGSLRRFLHKTGPLAAPSANFEGRLPSRNIKEAQKYFGGKIDFYINGGKSNAKPSTLVSVKNGKLVVLRKGAATKLMTRNVSTR